MWVWPLKNKAPMFPDEPGSFGSIRKFDNHTGVDLYCELGQSVIAVEDGEVISIENFTGSKADDPSPWWNDTQAVLIRGNSGVVVYGEVFTLVKVGDNVKAGQKIASVEQSVLKRFKGRPMVMLHMELMSPESTGTIWWKSEQPQPANLFDITPKLIESAGDEATFFDLSLYNEEKYRGDK